VRSNNRKRIRGYGDLETQLATQSRDWLRLAGSIFLYYGILQCHISGCFNKSRNTPHLIKTSRKVMATRVNELLRYTLIANIVQSFPLLLVVCWTSYMQRWDFDSSAIPLVIPLRHTICSICHDCSAICKLCRSQNLLTGLIGTHETI
jgi:hypothetical protein